jgi:hypothetical protein
MLMLMMLMMIVLLMCSMAVKALARDHAQGENHVSLPPFRTKQSVTARAHNQWFSNHSQQSWLAQCMSNSSGKRKLEATPKETQSSVLLGLTIPLRVSSGLLWRKQCLGKVSTSWAARCSTLQSTSW